MKKQKDLYPVDEYHPEFSLEEHFYDPEDAELKASIPLDGDGYALLYATCSNFNPVKDDYNGPFFMGFDDDMIECVYKGIYPLLVSAGVIVEGELAHTNPARFSDCCSLSLVFSSKEAGVLFIERLNAFMHKKREKLLEFILYGSTRPCAVCDEKPSLRTSLACEDCVEGAPQ